MQLERALFELPEEEAEQARTLHLDRNEFDELPEAVSRLRNLERLHCDFSRQLVRLLCAVAVLTKLQVLDCFNSPRFVSFPSSCTALINLDDLYLCNTALPAHLGSDICGDHTAVQMHLKLLAIYRLKPARAVARILLLTRRFRETALTFVNLDCVKMICKMIVQDGDSVEWEPLLERK